MPGAFHLPFSNLLDHHTHSTLSTFVEEENVCKSGTVTDGEIGQSQNDFFYYTMSKYLQLITAALEFHVGKLILLLSSFLVKPSLKAVRIRGT